MIPEIISEEEFDEILKKKGVIEQCRKLWWKHWKPYQDKVGGDKESLENFLTAVAKKGCKAPCYS